MTHPEIAKNLLLYRYSILDIARQRAIEMGHEKGLYFHGERSQVLKAHRIFQLVRPNIILVQISLIVIIQYYLVTQEEAFLKDYMAEMLFETARLWVDMGHMLNDQFRIDNVTGPDEYTCL